jgi:hypothetical protein
MSFNDPSGLERLRHTRGAGRVLAVLGLLTMLGGLGVFGFAIVSVFGARGNVPEIPSAIPIGFGIAIVGAIASTVGLAFGVPRNAKLGDHITYRTSIRGHTITAGSGSTITAPMDVRIDQRINIVHRLNVALDDVEMPDARWPQVEAAMAAVQDAVASGEHDSVVAQRLEHLTRLLGSVGALAGAGSAAAKAIVDLATTLGPAGRTVLSWFGL